MAKSANGTQFRNICFVKTGWSERYQGGPVYGRHRHLAEHKSGHEALNFMPGPDGRFYVHVPPHRIPEITDDWLVIVVAASTRDDGRSFWPLEPGDLRKLSFASERSNNNKDLASAVMPVRMVSGGLHL